MREEKRVALFVTCIVDQIMPEVGVATVQLLRRAGFAVAFPQAQTCCGQPFFNSGFRDQATALAKRTVGMLDPYPAVVLPSGSCTTMIREEYPHLLEKWPPLYYAALRVAKKTYELSAFLAEFAPDFLAENSEGAAERPITYHDSCHMCRTLGLKEEPRRALGDAGYTIGEMAESDRCCGFGGVFSLRMPAVSNAMTAEKIRQGRETGCETIVTADPGCLMQMRGMAGAGGDPAIQHLAVALARRLDGGAQRDG
jgi:L-lactate dehydrogenase complex protein LldE